MLEEYKPRTYCTRIFRRKLRHALSVRLLSHCTALTENFAWTEGLGSSWCSVLWTEELRFCDLIETNHRHGYNQQECYGLRSRSFPVTRMKQFLPPLCRISLVLWARHEKSPEVGTLRYILSQKHQSTCLQNRKTKLGINDPTSSVSVPLSFSASLLPLSVNSYTHKHTTRGRLEVGLYMWNGSSV
jgi:hypothetical protein